MTGQHPCGCEGLSGAKGPVAKIQLSNDIRCPGVPEVLAAFRAPISGPKIHRSDDVFVDENDPSSLLSISSTDS